MPKFCFSIFLFLTLLFGAESLMARNAYLDSLRSVWTDPHQPDTNRLNAIREFYINGYLYSNPDSAFFYAQVQYDLAEKKHLKKFMGQALNAQGISFYNRGNYSKAREYYEKSLKVRMEINDQPGIASCLNNLGNIYKEQADYANAIDCYTKALKTLEAIGNKRLTAMALNNIGLVYRDQKDYPKALDYQNKGLKIQESINDKDGMALSLNNIGLVYFNTGRLDEALDAYQRSLNYEQESFNKQAIANSLNNIGLVYRDKKEYAKAVDYQLQALKLQEEMDDQSGISGTLSIISLIYRQSGDFKQAIAYGTRALNVARKLGVVLDMRNASESLYDSYKLSGNYKQALEMFEMTIKMRDSVLSTQNQKEVMKQELQYNYEKQKAVDAKEQEKQLALAAEKEKRQTLISYTSVAGLILVLAFALFIVNRLRVARRQKAIIESQKELVEEKQKEILDSINYAKRLQEAILPPATLIRKHLPESFVLYKPKDIVAGDFYWMEVPGERGDVLIAAADSTGHGVPGAMVSVVCSNALNRSVFEFGLKRPGEILDKTRELVLETFAKSDKEVKDGMDISLCLLASDGKTLQWAGANNPLWLFREENGMWELQEIGADKQPIGKTEKPLPFKTHILEVKKGDLVYLFTDGYADQFGGPKGKKFKYRQLSDIIRTLCREQMERQKEVLQTTIDKWKGDLEQVDDICIIGIRI